MEYPLKRKHFAELKAKQKQLFYLNDLEKHYHVTNYIYGDDATRPLCKRYTEEVLVQQTDLDNPGIQDIDISGNEKTDLQDQIHCGPIDDPGTQALFTELINAHRANYAETATDVGTLPGEEFAINLKPGT
ncbi:MAG: hypothetical protein GY938_05415, partial [Ketobacter sp.]|nr:hypothetical protein [Ketobacter sp.]